MTIAALEISFWICTACVFYTFLGYPLLIGLIAHFRPRPIRPADGSFHGRISIVLVVHNEERVITRRLEELTRLVGAAHYDGEVIVVSDGSTDSTVTLAERYSEKGVRVIRLPENVGKAEALTLGCAEARGEVIVFADARQTWAPDALDKLVRNFSVSEVGAVTGELTLTPGSGVTAGVGLYWRYEKWLRRHEAIVHSTIGVTGAISAVRHKLFQMIPRGTLLDDVYWPLQVVMQGYRVVYEDKALAFDQLPKKTEDEFRRKVRTLCGNFQLLARLPTALLPWRNPVAIEFLSHKILRLAMPWTLLVLLFSSAALPHPLYRIALAVQVAFYVAGLFGVLRGTRPQPQLTSASGSFLVLNAAAVVALWIWLSGKAQTSWRRAQYGHSNEL